MSWHFAYGVRHVLRPTATVSKVRGLATLLSVALVAASAQHFGMSMLRPNHAVKRDVPRAGLRPRRGPPLTLVR